MVSEDELRKSVAVARSELRSQVDQQLKTASDIDTRAAALLALLGAAAGLVGQKLQLDSPIHLAAGLISAILAIVVSILCVLAMRPRNLSYGVETGALIEALGDHDSLKIERALVEGLERVRRMNRDTLNAKTFLFEAGLYAFVATLLSAIVLVNTGAVG
jgi:hypothetical protein